MEIKLNAKESEEYFYNALCNGRGCMNDYGLELEYDADEYKKSRKKLSEGVCFEDVLMQMLRDGYKLTINDIECEGEYTRSIGIEEVHERVEKTPLRHLSNMINENDDAETADVILQTVFFEDIIFG
jgi:hypothetical protein